MARLMMFFFFTVLAFGMFITGFALYSEGPGLGSWAIACSAGCCRCWVARCRPTAQPAGHGS